MTCGIYAIVCDKTWRSYIGQSVNIEGRKRGHLTELRGNRHCNKTLQEDFNKFGESHFHFEVIEETSKNDLCNRESYWTLFGQNLYNESNPIIKFFLSDKDKIRLWKKIDIKSENECWNWTGCKSSKGYGNFGIMRDGRQINIKPHRATYFLEFPNENQGLIIRHRCNNPSCCNPNHLIVGTFQDNAIDTLDNSNKRHKLNWSLVKSIREKIQENPNILADKLADWFFKKFGFLINGPHLVSVAMNQCWVDNDFIPPKRDTNVLSKEMVDEIRMYIVEQIPYPEIVRIFKDKYNIKTTPTTITNIKYNKIYRGE